MGSSPASRGCHSSTSNVTFSFIIRLVVSATQPARVDLRLGLSCKVDEC
jgi:hypothetical protein